LAEELNKINTAEIKYDALKRKRFEKAEKLRFEYIQKELAKLDKEQNRVYIEGGGKIDPERYLGSGLTWRRVGAFVSLLLAGIGGPAYLRVAHENIKGAIDRDIASQKAALAMKKEKWKTRRNLLGDMLKLTGSMSLAEKASRIQMAKEVDNLIEARKATTNIQSEKEKLTQLQIENRKSMEVDKKKLIPAHEIPMGVFVPKHHVKTKLQRETYVPIGNLGGQFAPDSSAAQKAREVVNKYNPAIQKSKKLIDFFKNPEYAGLFGKQTMIPKGMGKKANILEALHKDLLNEMRTLQGAGAAFTQAEIGLILGVIGKDFNSFTGLPLDERFHLVVGMLSEGLSYRLNSYGVDLAPEALFNYDRSAYKRAKAKILGQRE
jgi:hypothetical protein